MTTNTELITADELLNMPDDGRRYELIKGELIESTPPPGSSLCQFSRRPPVTCPKTRRTGPD